MLFQSLGGHYTYGQAIKHLFTCGSRRAKQDVISRLEQQFDARAYLYYKGRSGLSEGIRIATGGSGKVLVNSLTCHSVVEAVRSAGCQVVYIDVDPDTLNFDIKLVARAVKDTDVRAIIVQNTLGIMADIAAIRDAVGDKVAIIEDLAHSYGLQYQSGEDAGKVSDIVMLSFGRDKSLDIGNGGALLLRGSLRDEPVVEPTRQPVRIDRIRDRLYPIITWHARALYGLVLGKVIIRLGLMLGVISRSADGAVDTSMTISDTQAVWLGRALDEHEQVAIARAETLRLYAPLAGRAPLGARQSRGLLRVPLIVEDRAEVLARLAKRGIHCNDTWYDVPIIPSRLYADAGLIESEAPVATRLAQSLLNLPLHAGVKQEHIRVMTEELGEDA